MRSPKLTPALIAKLAEIVGDGNFRLVASQACGIARGTWHKWITTGNRDLKKLETGQIKEPTIHSKLILALEKAEADAHITLVQDVLLCGDSKLKLDFLRRRYTKLYSMNPNAVVDDETAEVEKVNGAEILAGRLAQLLGADSDE